MVLRDSYVLRVLLCQYNGKGALNPPETLALTANEVVTKSRTDPPSVSISGVCSAPPSSSPSRRKVSAATVDRSASAALPCGNCRPEKTRTREFNASGGGFKATGGGFKVSGGGFNASGGGFKATGGGFKRACLSSSGSGRWIVRSGEFKALGGAFKASGGGFKATGGAFK
eukprot:1193009-Prorocentrum_minimum.AAC.1